MENTVENARKFIDVDDAICPNDGICYEDRSDLFDDMVAYANLVRPEIVWPDDINGFDYRNNNEGAISFEVGYEFYRSELRRLNPHLSGTGENDSQKSKVG